MALFFNCYVVFHSLCFLLISMFVDDIFLKAWVTEFPLCFPSRLFILWLLYCICLSVPFASEALNLNDCVMGPLLPGFLGGGCRCFGLRRAFSRFCRRRGALLEKCGVSLKTLLQQGISEPEF